MIKYIKYLLVFLLATGFVACSEDEGAQILGGLYEKVDITPEPTRQAEISYAVFCLKKK